MLNKFGKAFTKLRIGEKLLLVVNSYANVRRLQTGLPCHEFTSLAARCPSYF